MGAAKAALEYLPLEVGVRNLTKMTGMGAKQVGALAGRVLGMAGIEGSTESVQTIMDLAARNFEQGKELMDFSPEDWEEVRTSGAKGAVVGGGITTTGAIPAAVSGVTQAAGGALVRRQMERDSVDNPAPNDETPPPGAPPGAEEQDFREGLAGGSATVAEGSESIRAQLGELFNRDSGKNAVFISASEDPSVLKEARTRIRNRPAFIIVQTDEGNLVIQKGKGFDEAAYKNADAATQDDIRAQLLGYQYNKRDLAGQTDLSVVRTKNKDGVVIHSEIAPTSAAQSVIQNQQAMFKMSDEATTEVVSMEQELSGRSTPDGKTTEGKTTEGKTPDTKTPDTKTPETKQERDYPRGDTVQGYKTRASAQGRATTLNKTSGDHQVIEYAPNESGTVFYGVRNRQKEKLEDIIMTEATEAIGPIGERIAVSEINARDTIDEIDDRISLAEKLRTCVLK